MWFDSATFRDKGTELRSLSLDKRTTGQAQNLATGRDGILTAFSVLGCPTGPLFCCFLFFGAGDFVPGRPRTEEFVPGF